MKKHLPLSLVLIIGLAFGLHSLAYASFSDVDDDHQYKTAIDFVEAEGIVQGYADGTYKPEQSINRAEFTKIVIEAVFDEFSGENCFPDVLQEWFAQYVCFAQAQGIIEGYPNGTFQPANTVNFAEAAKITTLAFGHEVESAFVAAEAWFEPYIDKLQELNAIPASITSLSDIATQGSKELTRGEMADIIYRLSVDQVSSDDGSLALFIPDGVLPEGVEASDISATQLEEDDEMFQDASFEDFIIYRLEPDGLQLDEALSFEVTYESTDNMIPQLFLISDGSLEIPGNVTVNIDSDTGKVVVSGEISHFSELAIAKGESSFFSVEIPKPEDVAVDEYVNVSISIGGLAHDDLQKVNLRGELSSSGEVLSPEGTVFDRPPKTLIPKAAGGTFSVNSRTDYKCDKLGPATIDYRLHIVFDLFIKGFVEKKLIRYDSTLSGQMVLIKVKSPSFHCLPHYYPFEVTLDHWNRNISEDFSVVASYKATSSAVMGEGWMGYGEFVERGGPILSEKFGSETPNDAYILKYEDKLGGSFSCEKAGEATVIYDLNLWDDTVDDQVLHGDGKRNDDEELLVISSDPVTFSCQSEVPFAVDLSSINIDQYLNEDIPVRASIERIIPEKPGEEPWIGYGVFIEEGDEVLVDDDLLILDPNAAPISESTDERSFRCAKEGVVSLRYELKIWKEDEYKEAVIVLSDTRAFHCKRNLQIINLYIDNSFIDCANGSVFDDDSPNHLSPFFEIGVQAVSNRTDPYINAYGVEIRRNILTVTAKLEKIDESVTEWWPEGRFKVFGDKNEYIEGAPPKGEEGDSSYEYTVSAECYPTWENQVPFSYSVEIEYEKPADLEL